MLDGTPKEFSRPYFPTLQHAETPHLEAHLVKDGIAPGKENSFKATGTPISFDHHTQSFQFARQVVQGGKSTTVTEHFGGQNAAFAGHSGGAWNGGSGRFGGGSSRLRIVQPRVELRRRISQRRLQAAVVALTEVVVASVAEAEVADLTVAAVAVVPAQAAVEEAVVAEEAELTTRPLTEGWLQSIVVRAQCIINHALLVDSNRLASTPRRASGSAGELKEAPLRRDVRSLGMLLGEVLREQAGDPLYEAVEALRRTAIARREAETPQNRSGQRRLATAHLQQALARVRSLDLAAAYQLTRAFGFYFELINLAETNHRKRRRLAHQLSEDRLRPHPARRSARNPAPPARGWRLRRRSSRACSAASASHPVFTAHPTEVARRSVMFKRRRISDLLEQLDRIPVPEPQLEALERDLIAEITALWQTDDVRSARPTVRDEIRMALDYYESSLFDTLPVLYAEVAAALAAEYPSKSATELGYK